MPPTKIIPREDSQRVGWVYKEMREHSRLNARRFRSQYTKTQKCGYTCIWSLKWFESLMLGWALRDTIFLRPTCLRLPWIERMIIRKMCMMCSNRVTYTGKRKRRSRTHIHIQFPSPTDRSQLYRHGRLNCHCIDRVIWSFNFDDAMVIFIVWFHVF